MKVSLICPVWNEESSIEDLIKSMLRQSRKADEIIFVDSFSNDGTADVIREYSKAHKEIRLIQEKSNIAEARNIAIRNSKHDIIAATDASCKLDKDWLKNIVAPFEDEKVDVVSGGYKAISSGGVEDYIAMLTVKPMDEWNEKTFLPSGRSVAFRKSAWKAVGGYPENLYTGEDTLFGLRLREKGFRFVLRKNALVRWRGRETVGKFIRQFYLYGKGDGESGNWKKMRLNLVFFLLMNFWVVGVIVSLILIPAVSLVFVLPLALYFAYGGIRYALKRGKIGCLFWIPILLMLKRFSYFVGVWRGLL